MKKIFSIILVMVLCTFLFSCSSDFTGYKSINIKGGTIKVPEDWSLSYADDLIYFSSENKDNIYAFQSNSFSAYKGDDSESSGIVEENAFANKFQNMYMISNNVISNGTVYGEAMVSVNGTQCKMKYLSFGYHETEVQLFVNTDIVDDEVYMKIAESFISK